MKSYIMRRASTKRMIKKKWELNEAESTPIKICRSQLALIDLTNENDHTKLFADSGSLCLRVSIPRDRRVHSPFALAPRVFNAMECETRARNTSCGLIMDVIQRERKLLLFFFCNERKGTWVREIVKDSINVVAVDPWELELVNKLSCILGWHRELSYHRDWVNLQQLLSNLVLPIWWVRR